MTPGNWNREKVSFVPGPVRRRISLRNWLSKLDTNAATILDNSVHIPARNIIARHCRSSVVDVAAYCF